MTEEASTATEDMVECVYKICINLAVLAEEKSISTFLDIDVMELYDEISDDPVEQRLLVLQSVRTHLHEAIYGCPSGLGGAP